MDFWLPKFALRFPFLYLTTLFCYEISAVFLVYQLRFTASLFDQIIFQQAGMPQIRPFFLWLAILILGRIIFGFGGDLFAKKVALGVKNRLRNLVVTHVAERGNMAGKNAAEMQSILLDDIESIDAFFSQFLPQVCQSFLIPVTLLAFVFPLDRLSGLVLALTAPLIPFFMVLIGKYSQVKNARQITVLHKMSAFFLESIQGIKTLILLNQTSRHAQRIEKVSEDFRKTTMEVLKVAFLSAFTLELLATISTAVIAVEIGLRLLYGRLTFEHAIFILLLAPEFYQPLRNLGARFHASMSGMQAAKNVFMIVDAGSSRLDLPVAVPQTIRFEAHVPLRLRSVSFQYVANAPVLDGIDLEFPHGKHTAIIGPTGAGKSTLFQLLMRFLSPTAGEILLGERNIREYPPDDWRAQIAWLPQNPLILNDSIRNNLLIARESAGEMELIRILEQVQLWDLVRTLPRQLDTNLAEFGRGLSSGERQKLAMARVLLRNSRIVLLDEPSASLDHEGEQGVITLLSQFPSSGMVISIAHRLNTVIHADQVIYLDHGRVQCAGKHADLSAGNSGYSTYCQAYFGGVQ